MEKKLKKYTLPFIAAILTVFALSMTGLYAGSADNPGETFLSLCKKEMTGIGIDKLVVLIAIIALYMKCWRNFCRSCKMDHSSDRRHVFCFYADRNVLFRAGKLVLLYSWEKSDSDRIAYMGRILFSV